MGSWVSHTLASWDGLLLKGGGTQEQETKVQSWGRAGAGHSTGCGGPSDSPFCTGHGTEALGTLELVGKVHPATELTLEFEGSTLLFGF